jgi:hypothetical protein
MTVRSLLALHTKLHGSALSHSRWQRGGIGRATYLLEGGLLGRRRRMHIHGDPLRRGHLGQILHEGQGAGW